MHKICVFSSSRADYGLLKPVLQKMKQDDTIDLHVIVTGTHLSKDFGETICEIEQDGFSSLHNIPISLGQTDDKFDMVACLSTSILAFAKTLVDLQPDYVLVLGDRFEIFAAAQAAYGLGFRLGHIHGGEVTYGALDDGFRHAITKLSHDHFPSHNDYAKRLIHMGEDPNSVFTCGAPGIDNLATFQKESLDCFQRRINMRLDQQILFLVTYHPATVFLESLRDNVCHLLKALDNFPKAKILITKANADPGGRLINHMMEDYEKNHKDRVVVHTSLGQEGYYQALSYADVVIGNSSSALIEGCYFNVPVVNIGDRQEGRVQQSAVINCTHDAIASSIEKALQDTQWREACLNPNGHFGEPGSIASLIVSHIKKRMHQPLKKIFYDLKTGE